MKNATYEATENFRFEVKIPSHSVDALRKAVDKKAKAMAKAFGIPSPLRVASISEEKILRTDSFFRPVLGRTALIEGEVIKVAGRHKILAFVERFGEGQIVYSFAEGFELGRKLDFCSCDHCGHTRSRKKLFLLEDQEGRVLQVGSSCMQEFSGVDGAKIANGYILAEGLARDLEKEFSESFGEKRFFWVYEVVSLALASIKERGFVSKAKASFDSPSTGSSVYTDLLRGEKVKDLDEKILQEAEEIIEKIQGIDPINDFDSNLKLLASQGAIGKEHLGLAVCIALRGLQIKEEEKKAGETLKKSSEFVGEVKKRQEFDVEVQRVLAFEGDYGVSHLVVMTDPAGNRLAWWSSNGGLDEDFQGKIKGTVKAHEVYKGERQTVLTRVKDLS